MFKQEDQKWWVLSGLGPPVNVEFYMKQKTTIIFLIIFRTENYI